MGGGGGAMEGGGEAESGVGCGRRWGRENEEKQLQWVGASTDLGLGAHFASSPLESLCPTPSSHYLETPVPLPAELWML